MQRLLSVASLLALAGVVACSRSYSPEVKHVGDTDVGEVASCPVTSGLLAKYYRDVAKQSVPDDIGGRSCVVDAAERLQAEADCANRANIEAFEAALTERGLTRTDHAGMPGYLDVAWDTAVGQVIELDPELREMAGADRVVSLGVDGSDDGCSGSRTHARANTTSFIARDPAGALVVVVPKPALELRTYIECTCFAGCGAEPMPPMRVFAMLRPGETISAAVDVPFAAISVVSAAVESQTCCCAP